jgi:galactose mutarotase-like enzyme
MGEVIEHPGAVPRLELRGDASSATLAPGRGGMLTSLAVGGRELFYLDESTLLDATKNVRGGAPVLFPSPGKLAHDMWAYGGRIGSMKQHGFARNYAFKTTAKGTAPAPSATLSLSSNEETEKLYPYFFALDLTYTLLDNGVRIDQRIENRGRAPMPFGMGFHPYFAVPDASKSDARIPTKATRAFDNTTKKTIDLRSGPIDLTKNEVDLHLIEHGGPGAELTVSRRGTISLTGSPEYRRWVVWTLRGKDFVCVEPWTCPGNALNTGEDIIELAPGESRTLYVEIVLR